MNGLIRRAVWSYWTKPFSHHYSSVWKSEKHHLLAWILSLETARRHCSETVLYTDDVGYELLVEGLGLNFTEVHTDLNCLKGADPDWWVLGKLYAYQAQEKPFIHIDTDVFLWNPIAKDVSSASVFGQNREWFHFDGGSWYQPKYYDERLRQEGGWMPEEWIWYVEHMGSEAVCCGVLGGQNCDFIRDYADKAIRFINHPDNQSIWASMDYKIGDNILFEQYFLSACIAFHTQQSNTQFQGINVGFIFESPEMAYQDDRAREIGYTHLIGGAKRNEEYAKRLEARVVREYPDLYKRCLNYYQRAA